MTNLAHQDSETTHMEPKLLETRDAATLPITLPQTGLPATSEKEMKDTTEQTKDTLDHLLCTDETSFPKLPSPP